MKNGASFTFHDLAPGEENFRDAVLTGLGRANKRIPCKFFYDARGSALFEEICRLPEYYPTRTEIAILEDNSADIAAQMGPHCRLIEFGSGGSQKVRILLHALNRPAAYVPVDISREHLRDAAISLAEDFPSVPVIAVCADYTRPFPLPPLPGGRQEIHPDLRAGGGLLRDLRLAQAQGVGLESGPGLGRRGASDVPARGAVAHLAQHAAGIQQQLFPAGPAGGTLFALDADVAVLAGGGPAAEGAHGTHGRPCYPDPSAASTENFHAASPPRPGLCDLL